MLGALRAGQRGDAIAASTGRTPRAIFCRQQHIACRMVAAGATLEGAAEATCLSPTDFQEILEERQAVLGADSSNKGRKWKPAEDAALVEASRTGRKMVELAVELGRTPGALHSHLQHIAATAAAANSVAAAAAMTGLSVAAVEDAVRKHRSVPSAPFAPFAAVPLSPPTPVTATQEQRAALVAVRGGRDVLLTGPAGTGKSFTVGLIVADARAMGKSVAVTATTGAAATLVGGMTIHSFLGIGTGGRPLPELLWNARAPRNKRALERVRAFDLLVVDEVSMMSDALFDKAIAYIDALRGGRRYALVLTGDFCQLPPVEGRFAFHAEAWKRRAPTVVQLTRLLRQTDDAPFQAMLGRLRWGRPSDEDLATLRALRATAFDGGVEPTRLHSRNAEVDRINGAAFDALLATGAPSRVYARYARGERAKTWADATNIPESVRLAVGAQVMVTRNLPALGLVNGSRGVVAALQADAVVVTTHAGGRATLRAVPIACEADPELACLALPLRLAYALSIHKSQGVTLDALEVDLGPSVFECGQGYVAISRARSLASVRVLDVDARAFRAHPDVVAFYGRTS